MSFKRFEPLTGLRIPGLALEDGGMASKAATAAETAETREEVAESAAP